MNRFRGIGVISIHQNVKVRLRFTDHRYYHIPLQLFFSSITVVFSLGILRTFERCSCQRHKSLHPAVLSWNHQWPCWSWIPRCNRKSEWQLIVFLEGCLAVFKTIYEFLSYQQQNMLRWIQHQGVIVTPLRFSWPSSFMTFKSLELIVPNNFWKCTSVSWFLTGNQRKS